MDYVRFEMKEAIRVLHIMPGFGGGISSHVRNIIDGIDESEVVIDVASFTTYPDDFIDEVEKKGGKTYTLTNVRLHNLFKCIVEMRSILKNGNYDAVHMHVSDKQALYFSILASSCGIRRKIVHAHIADQQGSNSYFFKIKKKINQFLTVSAATDLASCSKLASSFRFGDKYVRENQVMHLPNSIKVSNYFNEINSDEKKRYYKELNILPGQLVIGHVGYFGYQKNHPFMFKIADELIKKKIDFIWLFIGTGTEFKRYVSMAKKIGIMSNVRFLGRRSDVCELYKIMDVTVLASHFEGLPTVTIETQAAGTPTVISETITEETDMGLNMITRVSLNESVGKWCAAIIEKATEEVPCSEERRKHIEDLCFTTKTAAALYTKFLKGEVTHYNLGEKI